MKKKKNSRRTEAEEMMFWSGIGIGVLGGILGNLLMTAGWDMANSGHQTISSAVYLLSSAIILLSIYILTKRMKK
jgi:RsiW-degrading membrane proteinase PrsW (M82 family)